MLLGSPYITSLLAALGEVLEQASACAGVLSMRVILAQVGLEASVDAVVLRAAIGGAVLHPTVIM